MSENQVITPEQLEEYMQGLYAKSKVAQKKFEREFTTTAVWTKCFAPSV